MKKVLEIRSFLVCVFLLGIFSSCSVFRSSCDCPQWSKETDTHHLEITDFDESQI